MSKAHLDPVIPGHLLEIRAEDNPDKEVYLFEKGEQGEDILTYADLYRKSNRFAAFLKSLGLGKGDTFGLFMRNHPEFVYALMGGRKRVIPAQSSVGVHRMFNYSTNFDIAGGGFVRERNLDDGGMLQTLSRYAAMMGINTELVKLAERTSPDRLYMLSAILFVLRKITDHRH